MMRYRAASNAVALVALALAALSCGSPEQSGPPAGEPREVVIGTGEVAFENMDGEPQLQLVAGVQGGYHVWASFLAYGFTAPSLALLLTTTVDEAPESRIVMRANLTMHDAIDAGGEPAHTFAGFPAQVYGASCAHGKRVRIDVTLSDAEGGVANATRHCIADVEESRRAKNCL